MFIWVVALCLVLKLRSAACDSLLRFSYQGSKYREVFWGFSGLLGLVELENQLSSPDEDEGKCS